MLVGATFDALKEHIALHRMMLEADGSSSE